jgi:hypothetical protein
MPIRCLFDKRHVGEGPSSVRGKIGMTVLSLWRFDNPVIEAR